MAEKNKADISPQKRSLKLTPMIGDWTTYKPPQTTVKKIKLGLYGFDRLSEEELKQAHLLHYNFALTFSKALKEKMRTGTEIYSVEAHQNVYSNFIKSSNMLIFQGKIITENYNDEIFISFDLQTIDSLINFALGSQDTSRLSRGLTKAEEIVLDAFLNEYMPSYYTIFKDVLQNPQFLKIGAPNLTPDQSISLQSTFVYFPIDLSINGNIGRITFGYSGAFIKNILKDLNQNKKSSPLPIHKIPPSIFNSVKLPVHATIGNSSLSMSEIYSLEPGDVVSFEQKIEDAIQIVLADGRVILGQPGKKDGKIIVRVVGFEKEKSVKVEPPIYQQEAPILEEPVLKDDEPIKTPVLKTTEEPPLKTAKVKEAPHPIVTKEIVPEEDIVEEEPKESIIESKNQVNFEDDLGLEDDDLFDLEPNKKLTAIKKPNETKNNDLDFDEDYLDLDLDLDEEEKEDGSPLSRG